jgi:fructose-1-phosphate kinase PfkB-like protein
MGNRDVGSSQDSGAGDVGVGGVAAGVDVGLPAPPSVEQAATVSETATMMEPKARKEEVRGRAAGGALVPRTSAVIALRLPV